MVYSKVKIDRSANQNDDFLKYWLTFRLFSVTKRIFFLSNIKKDTTSQNKFELCEMVYASSVSKTFVLKILLWFNYIKDKLFNKGKNIENSLVKRFVDKLN